MHPGDVLTVWKLDRLAQSVRQLNETVERLERAEIGIRSLTVAIDTTTPDGYLIYHIYGALAEFERAIIRERTIPGLDAARAQGCTGGRPPKLGPKEIEAAQAMLWGSGLITAETCRQLGGGRATFYRHLNASAWEREAPRREAVSEAMRQPLKDDMEARSGVHRRMAAS